MQRRDILLTYVPMANYIAAINGPNCEVVIHDTRNLESSLIYITSPNLTGRKEGARLTEYAKQLVENKRHLISDFEANYVAMAPDSSRIFRSATYFIRDGAELIGLLCVNIDITELLSCHEVIERAMVIPPSMVNRGGSEIFGTTADEIIEKAISALSGEWDTNKLPAKAKKMLALQLKEQGVFKIKGAVIAFANRIKVSEQTVYRYIK